jgi:hypothetical protein
MKHSAIVIFAILMMASMVLAAPTDDWDYVQPLNVSNENDYNLNDFQVEVILTSSNVGSNFNWTNDGNDLRFIALNGTEFDYFINSWVSATPTGTVTVEVSGLTATSNTTIYMVYGNTAATPKTNSTATYVLYDQTSHNVISSPYTWDIKDYNGDWKANWHSAGNYGGDSEFMYFYDKNTTGSEVSSIRTYKNFHSSAYHDHTYLNMYMYADDGTPESTLTSSYDIGRYQTAYSVNTQIIKSNNTYTLTNNKGVSITRTNDAGIDQWHDGVTKLKAQKYYTSSSSRAISVSSFTIIGYAEEDVLFESIGSESVYNPDDFIISDSCTYSGTGNWTIALGDDCTINTNYDLGTNKILLTGTGDVTFNSSINISNMPSLANNQNINIDSNAYILVG